MSICRHLMPPLRTANSRTRRKFTTKRLKRADVEPVDVPEGEVIDVSAFKPRRIPSKKWRELIKKVWEADPLLCPHCQNEMRIVALIDDADVIERILRQTHSQK